MADISMCRGTKCPKKKRCYRYTAPVNEYWQAYFTIIPYNKETKICDHFVCNKYYKNETTKSNSKTNS
jgi:hypothetical protein